MAPPCPTLAADVLLLTPVRYAGSPKTLSNREDGSPHRFPDRGRKLASQATTSGAAGPSIVGQLARFFPEATPVRIPVKLTRLAADNSENTVIEFGTAREVLFAAVTPLEFADTLRVQNSDGSLDAEAAVVAVQYHNGQTAVAARFTHAVANWIVKP